MAITPTIDYNTLARMSVPTTPSRSLGNYSGAQMSLGASRATPTATTGQSGWQKTNDFLGSPAGKLAMGGAAAGLSMYAQGKQGEAQRAAEEAMQRERLAAERESMLAKLATEQSQNATARAIAGARPIGEAQKFAGSMAKGNAILDLLGSGPMTPGNADVAKAANLGSLPRVSADALQRMRSTYSEPATLQSLLSRDQDVAAINPNAAPTNYAQLTQSQQESPLTRALMSQFADYRQNSQTQLEDSESYARRLLEQAIDGTSSPVGTGAARAASPFPLNQTGTATPSGAGGANTAKIGNTATLPARPAANTPVISALPSSTQGAVARSSFTPQEQTGGAPGASYYESLINTPPNPAGGVKYEGGKQPPRAEHLTGNIQAQIRGQQGIDARGIDEKDVQKLLDSQWQYGRPAPPGFHYSEEGLFKKNGDTLKTIAKIAIIAGATAATMGTASPWVAAAIGAGAGAGTAAIDGGNWKQILTGAAIGGVTGGAASGIANSGLNAAQKIGASAAVNAGAGALTGGTKGALIGAVAGGGGAAIAPATSRLTGPTQTAAQAGMNASLTKALGGSWIDAGLAGGMTASTNAANQQKLKQYQQQQARGAYDAAGRLVRG